MAYESGRSDKLIEDRILTLANTLFLDKDTETLKEPLDKTYMDPDSKMNHHVVAFVWDMAIRWSKESIAFAYIYAWKLSKKNWLRRIPMLTFLLLHVHELDGWEDCVSDICKRIDEGNSSSSSSSNSGNSSNVGNGNNRNKGRNESKKERLKQEEADAIQINEKMKYLYNF
jgi:hypothetical protein